MFKHAGQERDLTYSQQTYRFLKYGGIFLNHAINSGYRKFGGLPLQSVRKYVFPGGDLPSIYLTVEKVEEAGFEIRGVECMEKHYTLMHCVRNPERNYGKAVQIAGEEFRILQLYMEFLTGRIDLYQTVFVETYLTGKFGLSLTGC